MDLDTATAQGAATADLKVDAARGVRWTLISLFIRQGIGIVTSAILARFVSPSEFGIMAMALVVTGFAGIFRDVGTSVAIVRRRAVDQTLLSNVFWLTGGIGVLLTAAVAACAWPLAGFFGEPRLVFALVLISGVFLLGNLSAVHQALLQRELKFRQLAHAELLSAFCGAAVAVGVAANGGGVYALIAQQLVLVGVSSCAIWHFCEWRPTVAFSVSGLRPVFGFSIFVMLYTVLNYWARNADNLLIGKVLGAAELGRYSMAYKFLQYALLLTSGVCGRVLVAALARRQDDDVAFRRAYFRAVGLISLVAFPMCFNLAVLAKPTVTLVLSTNWVSIAPLVSVFAAVAANQAIAATVGNIYIAKGRSAAMFTMGAASAVLYVAAIVFGMRWGIMGVAICYAAMDVALTLPNYIVPFRMIGATMGSLALVIWRPLVCCAISAPVLALSVWYDSAGTAIGYVGTLITSITAYVSACTVLNKSQLRDLLMVVSPSRAGR